VLGTVDLLLAMKSDPDGLPRLSDTVGTGIRTNNEALIGVIAPRAKDDLSEGVAIGSIYQTDEHSHLEPVRYRRGSGVFRLLMAPHTAGTTAIARVAHALSIVLRHPLTVLRAYLTRDWARHTVILLYMRTFEGTLRLRRAWHGGLTTDRDQGEVPTAAMPQATELAHAYADEIGGMPFSLVTETLFNIPTTAHILGGSCMGKTADTGVIDADHQVHGYEGLYVMDGSAMSANPGVNPSLTIVAMAERACSRIPAKVTARSDAAVSA
jgi:cholesterol oxidase